MGLHCGILYNTLVFYYYKSSGLYGCLYSQHRVMQANGPAIQVDWTEEQITTLGLHVTFDEKRRILFTDRCICVHLTRCAASITRPYVSADIVGLAIHNGVGKITPWFDYSAKSKRGGLCRVAVMSLKGSRALIRSKAYYSVGPSESP